MLTRIQIIAVIIIAVLVGGAVRGQQPSPAAASCTALGMQRIAPDKIGLPSRGAAIASTRLVPAAPETKVQPSLLNPSGLRNALPEYCEVKGQILPIDPSTPPINFQVNLPTDWNGKALQMGGGGWDGTLQAADQGLFFLRAPESLPYPLTRGYATFGTDGGHEGNDAAFALNDEALTNFAYGHLKKAHDVAMALIRTRYNAPPRRTYFVGQSGGGRQGLRVVQQFPQDYDGVVVTAPAIRYTNLMMRFNDVATALAKPGAFLGPGQVTAFGAAVRAQCDMNDGVSDGIVGDYSACDFNPSVLRCKSGEASSDCFSEAQIESLAAVYRETVWKDAKGNVIVSYPRFLLGGGEALAGGLGAIIGRVPMPRPQPPGRMAALVQLGVGGMLAYGNTGVRYLIARDGSFDTVGFDHRPYAPRIVEAVKLLSTDDPNLSRFQERGGKLIILHNTSDLAVTPASTIDYYNNVVKTMGASKVQQFARLYIVPGGDHGGFNTPSKTDLLGALEKWVEAGQSPGNNLVVEEDNPDRSVMRTKPLCAFPTYPRYIGQGDPKVASSYRCTEISRKVEPYVGTPGN